MIPAITDAIQYTTFADFASKVRRVAFPESIGERVLLSHNNFLNNALIKGQKFIDCLRSMQISVFEDEHVTAHCGVGRIVAPRGKINAVYTIKPDGQCDKLFHDHVTPNAISCWIDQNRCKWDPPNTKEFVAGDVLCADEDDSETIACYRNGPRLFGVSRERMMYLAPRPPCGCLIIIHWEGIRRHWGNNDIIPDDQELIDWVAIATQAEIALRSDRNPQRHQSLKAKANSKFADLMWWCTEERRIQARRECVEGLDPGLLVDMFQPIYEVPCEPTVFTNAEQTCTVECPDGTTFSYTVPEGQFTSRIQALADEQAMEEACEQAELRKVCFSPIGICAVCVGFEVETSIVADSTVPVASWLVSGNVPEGLTFTTGVNSNELIVSGTPTVAGNYEFTVTAITPSGSSMSKPFTIAVLDIATTALPGYTVGVPYSFQLEVTGGSGDYAWRIAEGELPDGLTMSLSGLISGTPTEASTNVLTFEVLDMECENQDKSFYPPQVALDTTSDHIVATVHGFPEFGVPSTPPRLYKIMTREGYSEQMAIPEPVGSQVIIIGGPGGGAVGGWRTDLEMSLTVDRHDASTTAPVIVPALGSTVVVAVDDVADFEIGQLVIVGIFGVGDWWSVSAVGASSLTLLRLNSGFNTAIVGSEIPIGTKIFYNVNNRIAHARIDWTGTAVINLQGDLIQTYKKWLSTPCPNNPLRLHIRWGPPPWDTVFFNVPSQLHGYCWPYDPPACQACEFPLKKGPDIAPTNKAGISQDSTPFAKINNDGLGGGIAVTKTSIFDTTGFSFLGHGYRPGYTEVIGNPTVRYPDTDDGDWYYLLHVRAKHNFSIVLSDEYTDAEALANAETFQSNSRVASRTPRTTGFTSTYVDVEYRLNLSNLLIGEKYIAKVQLVSHTGDVTVREYEVTAVAATHVITDTIPQPPDFGSMEVRQPEVDYAP